MSAPLLIRETDGVPTSASRAPAPFVPVLRRLADEGSVHFGRPGVRLEAVDYRERPFSHLVRAAVFAAGDARPVTHVFVKIFKVKPQDRDPDRMRRRVIREFETTREIHQALAADADAGAVRPIACYPEHLASVTEEVSGPTLLACVESDASWFPQEGTLERLSAIMAKAGRWVRVFQAIDASAGRVSIADLRSYVDLRLERLVASPAASFGPAERERVLAHIDRLGALVPEEDLSEARIHADLAPANVVVSGGRIVVLDFAMCGRGSVYHDLSRLFLQIDLLRLKPQFGRGAIDRLGRALLRGFDPGLRADRPMFRLLLLQHRINHLATLSLAQERFPASLYSWHVRRHHRACLARELASDVGGARP